VIVEEKIVQAVRILIRPEEDGELTLKDLSVRS
jgi:hypothetical protein